MGSVSQSISGAIGPLAVSAVMALDPNSSSLCIDDAAELLASLPSIDDSSELELDLLLGPVDACGDAQYGLASLGRTGSAESAATLFGPPHPELLSAAPSNPFPADFDTSAAAGAGFGAAAAAGSLVPGTPNPIHDIFQELIADAPDTAGGMAWMAEHPAPASTAAARGAPYYAHAIPGAPMPPGAAANHHDLAQLGRLLAIPAIAAIARQQLGVHAPAGTVLMVPHHPAPAAGEGLPWLAEATAAAAAAGNGRAAAAAAAGGGGAAAQLAAGPPSVPPAAAAAMLPGARTAAVTAAAFTGHMDGIQQLLLAGPASDAAPAHHQQVAELLVDLAGLPCLQYTDAGRGDKPELYHQLAGGVQTQDGLQQQDGRRAATAGSTHVMRLVAELLLQLAPHLEYKGAGVKGRHVPDLFLQLAGVQHPLQQQQAGHAVHATDLLGPLLRLDQVAPWARSRLLDSSSSSSDVSSQEDAQLQAQGAWQQPNRKQQQQQRKRKQQWWHPEPPTEGYAVVAANLGVRDSWAGCRSRNHSRTANTVAPLEGMAQVVLTQGGRDMALVEAIYVSKVKEKGSSTGSDGIPWLYRVYGVAIKAESGGVFPVTCRGSTYYVGERINGDAPGSLLRVPWEAFDPRAWKARDGGHYVQLKLMVLVDQPMVQAAGQPAAAGPRAGPSNEPVASPPPAAGAGRSNERAADPPAAAGAGGHGQQGMGEQQRPAKRAKKQGK